jgi:hypothetical protein
MASGIGSSKGLQIEQERQASEQKREPAAYDQKRNRRHRYCDAQLEIEAPERLDCSGAAKVRRDHRGHGKAEQRDQALTVKIAAKILHDSGGTGRCQRSSEIGAGAEISTDRPQMGGEACQERSGTGEDQLAFERVAHMDDLGQVQME